ncbi:PglL family O-oligosaccharyltransferase [Crenobacter cavernae]|nr:Wzy polymerase domain-containing protein [Crenobacter cavernae]
MLLAPLSFAFLSPLRYAPLPDWCSDVAAAALIALAALFAAWLPSVSPSARLHRVQLGLAALAVGLVLPSLSVMPAYPGVALQAATVLLLLMLAASLQQQAIARLGRDAVLTTFAAVVLLGALLQAAIGFAQALGLAPLAQGWLLFDMNAPTTVLGNIGQRNQLGHYLGWGLVSACYLHSVGRLRIGLFVPVALALALLMGWSASRLVLGYGLGLGVLTLIWLRRADDGALRRFGKAAGIALLCLAVCLLWSQEINAFLRWLGLPVHAASGSERMMDAGFGARRRVEWAKAWRVFLDHPLAGVGWGGYAYESVRLEALGLFGRMPENALFTHTHNIFMQLLAETGVAGTIIVVGGGLWAAWPLFARRAANANSLFVLAMLMISTIHSLFEYPLWYLPFLLGVTLLLGFSPAPAIGLPVRSSLRRFFATVLAVAVLAYAATGVSHFRNLSAWLYPSPSPAENVERIRSLVDLGRNPLWSYEADLVLSGYQIPSRQLVAVQRPLFERLASYRPYPNVLQKLAVARQMQGDTRGAKEALAMAVAAYPGLTPAYMAYFAQMKDPAMKPLAAFTARAAQAYKAGGPVAAADAASALLKVSRR